MCVQLKTVEQLDLYALPQPWINNKVNSTLYTTGCENITYITFAACGIYVLLLFNQCDGVRDIINEIENQPLLLWFTAAIWD